MKKLIVVLIALLVLPSITLAAKGGNKPPGGLEQEIADREAADIVLQSQIDTIELTPGPRGYSCTTENIPGGAQITCEDGSVSFIASEGTVISYPSGVIGEVNPVSYPSGDIVYVDADNIIIGKAYTGTIGFLQTDDGHLIRISNNSDTSEVVLTFREIKYWYLQKGCVGTPSINAVDISFVLQDSSTGLFYIGDNSVSSGQVLAKSFMTFGVCTDEDSLYALYPIAQYFVAPEILNAAYPVEFFQLP